MQLMHDAVKQIYVYQSVSVLQEAWRGSHCAYSYRRNERTLTHVLHVTCTPTARALQDYLDQVQNRTKEKRYTFDVAFDSQVGARAHTHTQRVQRSVSVHTGYSSANAPWRGRPVRLQQMRNGAPLFPCVFE